MSLAIEALWQISETHIRSSDHVTLRDIDISTALVVDGADSGVEIQLRLEQVPQRNSEKEAWYSFAVESLSKSGDWVVNCRGKISAIYQQFMGTGQPSQPPPVGGAQLQQTPAKRWYDALDRVGFHYGPVFQQLNQVKAHRGSHMAEGDVMVLKESNTMQDESRYIIHPSTIDACLQLIIISIHDGKHKKIPWGVVPIRLDEITLRFPGDDVGVNGTAVAWTDGFQGRYFNTHVHLVGQSGQLLVDINALRCVTYEAAVPAHALEKETEPCPFSTLSWKPDIMRLRPLEYSPLKSGETTEAERLAIIIDLICHRQFIPSVLLCGDFAQDMIDQISSVLPKSTNLILSPLSPLVELDDESNKDRTQMKPLPENVDDWARTVDGPHNLVVANESVSHQSDAVQRLVTQQGFLAYSASNSTVLKCPDCAHVSIKNLSVSDTVRGPRQITGLVTEPNLTRKPESSGSWTVFHPAHRTTDPSLISGLSEKASCVQYMALHRFDNVTDNDNILIDDSSGDLLDSLDSGSFECLKSVLGAGLPVVWLTRGVRQGSSTHGGMAAGFLRVIRSEQAAARVLLLDVDLKEDPADVSDAIFSMQDVPTKSSGSDTEFCLHRGMLHIGRVRPNTLLNSEWALSSSSAPKSQPLPEGIRLSSELLDGHLVFSVTDQLPALDPKAIEIQTLASELQTAPNAAIVVAGIVLRCGSLVENSLQGQRVVAFTNEPFPTIVQTARYALLDPATVDMVALVADMSALCKATTVCKAPAGVRRGDRILALPGPTSTLHALIRASNVLQWDLQLVVGSEAEKQDYTTQFNLGSHNVLLAMDGKAISSRICPDGRSIVLAHDFSSFSQDVWRHLPASGAFVLNETTLEGALDPLPLTRGASFISSSLNSLDDATVSDNLTQALLLVKEHPQLAGHSAAVFDIDGVKTVSEITSDIPAGKIPVFRYHYNESQVKVCVTYSAYCLPLY